METTTNSTQNNTTEWPLYLAFELGDRHWKLGFTIGLGQRPRERTIPAGNVVKLQAEVNAARQRFGLSETHPLVSCYEAGRDGFWQARYLSQQGIENVVVDASSIEVKRRYRRAKTDRLDLNKLLTMLIRYHSGEAKVWHVVHVPSVAQEDQRQLHRELLRLKGERTSHINRLKGLLVGQGVRLAVKADFLQQLAQVRLWDGTALPPGLQARLTREYERLALVKRQIKALEVTRREAIRHSNDPSMVMVRQLLRLKGIGPNTAWLYTMEFFSWRQFRNRRELGALAGLTPTPYQSGSSAHEQGIDKSGNRYIRAIAIEIAWRWLFFQPESALSQWYQQRFGQGSSRLRKIGIVALARKLLIALWRYLQTGEIPPGAVLSAETL
jgi:transposase